MSTCRARTTASTGRAGRSARWAPTRGRSATSTGRPPLADDADVAAQVEVTRAYVEAETGDPAVGVALCPSVLARDDLEPETAGKAWQQLGLLRMRIGEADAALDAFARRHRRCCLPASRISATRCCNRGNVHLQRRQARPRRRRLPRRPATRWAARARGGSAPRPSTTSATRGCSPATWSGRCRRSTEAADVLPGLGGQPRDRRAGPRRDPHRRRTPARGDPGPGGGRRTPTARAGCAPSRPSAS